MSSINRLMLYKNHHSLVKWQNCRLSHLDLFLFPYLCRESKHLPGEFVYRNMGRVLALDIGQKRIGVAVTDPEGIIATGLDTLGVDALFPFLDAYFKEEKIDRIVVGWPVTMRNQPSDAVRYIQPIVKKLRVRYPDIPLEQVDERFTSSLAHRTMLEGGVPLKKRQNKALADRISAVIILQSWMEKKKFERER